MVNTKLKAGRHFWQNVTYLLEMRGRSARSLALETGVAPATFTKYSRGSSPSLDIAAAIAQALEVSLEQLVFMTPEVFQKVVPSELQDTAHALTLRSLEREAGTRLAEELGLGRIAHLAATSRAQDEVSILELLSRSYPRALTEHELLDALYGGGDRPKSVELAMNLADLITKGLVVEDSGAPVRYRSSGPDIMVKWHDGRHREELILTAVKSLLRDVLPTLEKHPRSARCLTARFRVAPGRFQALAARMVKDATESWQDFDSGQDGEEVVAISVIAMPEEAS